MKQAESRWELLEYYPGKVGKTKKGDGKAFGFSLVKWRLVTGRPHQIRLHANYKGNTVLGDPLYSGKKMKQITCIGKVPISGQLLHAYQLSFVHPTQGTVMTLCAPLPEYFDAVLDFFKHGK